ncbi:MAG TPA: RNA polymerase sigma-70 factor [Pedobacter sp.]|uniref:RNA polymerase sigma factor n=1 Tax=Pedobacter sp. TaxID=1411316 RepID=UPI002CC5DDB1|nr:RNA polymerase sigma-70 factor [Pedobacter sp.]HMI01263.1 RNA polymerase sigma-70 factor [Pedobacter sp.]
MNANHLLLDNELAALLKEGDQEAFTELYKRFFKPLYIHAFKKMGNDGEAIDIVQDLFEFLWSKRNELEISNFSAYLYASIRNRIFTLKVRSDRKNVYLDSLKEFIDRGEFVTDAHIRERELAALIEREINALPAQMKKVFVMSRTEGLSHKDIAEQLGTSEHTVRTQVKKSLRILRSRIGIIAYLILLIHH